VKLQEWENKCYRSGLSFEFLEKFKEQVIETRKQKKLLQENAFNTAKEIAQELVKKGLAEKVYLFGSFARKDYYERSDLDLYIAGHKGDTDEIYKIAEQLCRDRKVSIVFEEDNVPWIEEIINREGISLC
jgi:predicted nucleotidyltransferase